MKRVVTTFIFVAVVLSMTILNANASIVTYNGTVNPFQLGSTATTSITQFNSSLGTLTGVQITLNLEATPYAEPFNFSSSPAVFTTSDWASCSFPPASPPDWTISHGSDSWTMSPTPGTTGQIYGTGQTMPAHSGLILLGSTSVNEDWTGTALLANLAEYIGAGTLSFGVNGAASYAIYDQSLFIGGGVDLTGTASVTYNYTPVPEPATMCLLGLGALGLLRKRRA